jgi:protein-S-isoprenylcysteine O-methyltransferase Ste14
MFLKALFAFIALPGVVAFLGPWLLVRKQLPALPRNWIALAPVAIGIAMLLWCVRDFYVAGKGTLAPWSPPQHLVTVGLYKYTRNPMYVAVSVILLGWAGLFGSMTLLVYALVVMAAFHIRVVVAEEPWLARSFPEDWARYRARTPRWIF